MVLRDRHVVALAACTAAGAWRGGGPPLLVGAAVVVVGLALRRPVLLGAALACLAATLADRAVAGLDPVRAAPFDGWVQLVADPAPLEGGGVRVDVAAGGRRIEATAFGAVAVDLEGLLAGERVLVSGRLRPRPVDAPWLVARRVVGRLAVEEARATAPGSAATRLANALRRTFGSGAEHLATTPRSLLGGVVLGDDREQPPELVDDFRAAGLSHLTVVSGQNVAFVLIAFGPLLRRLRWRSRLPVTLALLGAFALVVRFEPSVLRAVAMAGVAAVAAATGRPTAGGRILALAVAGLVLVDPLLVRSVGFLLSVSASAAILHLSPRLRVAVGGPAWLAEPLAVTIAAQVGTAPLLLATFGPLPVASIPANLLAVPVAGALMVWGLGVGFLAGLGPGWAATALHLPTRVLTWWLATVADRVAGLPLGTIDARRGLVLLALVGAGWALRRARDRGGARIAGGRPLVVGLAALVLLSASLARPSPPRGPAAVGDVGTLWSSAGRRVLVLDGGGGAERGLEALRHVGARCVDVVVVERATPGGVALAAALLRRCDGVVVLAQEGVARPGWEVLPPGAATPGAVGRGSVRWLGSETMTDGPTAEDDRERAIVDEAIAAIAGTPAHGTDHPAERRRVRTVIDAIRGAR
jgi:competence protein ComEC